MIKVSVMYPNGEGKHFDQDYYKDKHVPMVLGLLGDACKGGSIDNGLSGADPASPAKYNTMGHMLFESIEDFQGSFGPNAPQIMGDLPNFTNIEPEIQISQMVD